MNDALRQKFFNAPRPRRTHWIPGTLIPVVKSNGVVNDDYVRPLYTFVEWPYLCFILLEFPVRVVLQIWILNKWKWWKHVIKFNGAEPSCPYAHYKGLWGNGGIAPLIDNLGTRWRWVVGFTPQSLHKLGAPRYLLNRRLDGPQSRLENFGEDKVLLVRLEIENSCPVRSAVLIPTTLSGLDGTQEGIIFTNWRS
jgi:hypothetical protein